MDCVHESAHSYVRTVTRKHTWMCIITFFSKWALCNVHTFRLSDQMSMTKTSWACFPLREKNARNRNKYLKFDHQTIARSPHSYVIIRIDSVLLICHCHRLHIFTRTQSHWLWLHKLSVSLWLLVMPSVFDGESINDPKTKCTVCFIAALPWDPLIVIR